MRGAGSWLGGKRPRRCDSRAGTGGVPGRRGTEPAGAGAEVVRCAQGGSGQGRRWGAVHIAEGVCQRPGVTGAPCVAGGTVTLRREAGGRGLRACTAPPRRREAPPAGCVPAFPPPGARGGGAAFETARAVADRLRRSARGTAGRRAEIRGCGPRCALWGLITGLGGALGQTLGC